MNVKKIMLAVAGAALALSFAACGEAGGGGDTPPPESTGIFDVNGDGLITVGFSQVGSESGWRTANTQSFMDYFVAANGFDLVFADANGDADKQKQDVRAFIDQGVELIILAPVTNVGWEPVLMEVKDAGIPLIVADRKLDVDEDLYLFFFGGNMEQEGKTAVAWLENYITANGFTDPIKIAHLQGQMGSTAQEGRTKALMDAYEANGWEIVYQQTGEFGRTQGQAAMESFLANGKGEDFNVIYGENDDMVYGAIDALAAIGRSTDNYIIISFDGNKTAVQMVIDGKIDVIAECTPLLGPQIGALIMQANAGQNVAKVQWAEEGFIDATNAAQKIEIAFGS